MSNIVTILMYFIEAVLKAADDRTRRYYLFNTGDSSGKDVANLVATYCTLRQSIKTGYVLLDNGIQYYLKDYPILNVFQRFVESGRVFVDESLIDLVSPLYEYSFDKDEYQSEVRKLASAVVNKSTKAEELKSINYIGFQGDVKIVGQLSNYEVRFLMPSEVDAILRRLGFDKQVSLGNVYRGISLSDIDIICDDGVDLYSLSRIPKDLEQAFMTGVKIDGLKSGCLKLPKPTQGEIVQWMYSLLRSVTI